MVSSWQKWNSLGTLRRNKSNCSNDADILGILHCEQLLTVAIEINVRVIDNSSVIVVCDETIAYATQGHSADEDTSGWGDPRRRETGIAQRCAETRGEVNGAHPIIAAEVFPP